MKAVQILSVGVSALLMILMALVMLQGESASRSIDALWRVLDQDGRAAFQSMIEQDLWAPLWSYLIGPVLNTSAPLVLSAVIGMTAIAFWINRGRAGRNKIATNQEQLS